MKRDGRGFPTAEVEDLGRGLMAALRASGRMCASVGGLCVLCVCRLRVSRLCVSRLCVSRVAALCVSSVCEVSVSEFCVSCLVVCSERFLSMIISEIACFNCQIQF